MGILDEVFAGKDGVTNILHETLGGTAYLTYVNQTEKEYDVDRAEYIIKDDDVTEPVPFAPRPITSQTVNAQVQTLVDQVDICGTIPACKVTYPIKDGIDRFTYKNIGYTIIKSQLFCVGDTENLLLVFGKKSHG